MSPSEKKALEDLWHQRLTGAKLRLEAAQLRLHDFLHDNPLRDCNADGHFAYRQAVRNETSLLREYARVRRIYENLAVRGIIPDQEGLAREAGAES